MKKTKKKPTLVAVYPVGMSLAGTGNRGLRALPTARMLYSCGFSDGSNRLVYGRAIRGVPGFEDLNGTKRERAKQQRFFRPDLARSIEAASVLLGQLEEACADADSDNPCLEVIDVATGKRRRYA